MSKKQEVTDRLALEVPVAKSEASGDEDADDEEEDLDNSLNVRQSNQKPSTPGYSAFARRNKKNQEKKLSKANNDWLNLPKIRTRKKKKKKMSEEEKENDQRIIKTYNIEESQYAEFKECFAMFDQKDDGTISPLELSFVLRAFGANPTEADIVKMKDLCVEDRDDKDAIQMHEVRITCEDLIRITAATIGFKNESDNQEELENALQVFDKNNCGYIDANELKEVLKSMGEPLTDEDIKEMLQLAEVDPEGKLNYYAFMEMLCSK